MAQAPDPKFQHYFCGPIISGVFLNTVLYGVVFAQTFAYFRNFRHKDCWKTQLFVGALIITETANTVINIAWIYNNALITFAWQTRISWLFASNEATTALVSAFVQNYFAWRIRVLTQNWRIAGPIHLLAVTCLGAGLWVAGANKDVSTTVRMLHGTWLVRIGLATLVWLATMVACDVAITTALTWKLKRCLGFSDETNDILNKIMRLTVQNGAIICVCIVADVILLSVLANAWHLVPRYALPKIYSNSAMSSLNCRDGSFFTSAAHETETDISQLQFRNTRGQETLDARV